MNHRDQTQDDAISEAQNAHAPLSLDVVCEHATAHIPAAFNKLCVKSEAFQSNATRHPATLAGAEGISEKLGAILFAVHRFMPIHLAKPRDFAILISRDGALRRADVLHLAADASPVVRWKEPSGSKDGAGHSLKECALADGHLETILEVRNKLLASQAAQASMADTVSARIEPATAGAETAGC